MEQAVRLYEESLQQGEDETSGKPFNIEILFTEIPSCTVEFLETAEKDEQFFKGVQPIKQTNSSILKEGEQGWMELQTPKMESEELIPFCQTTKNYKFFGCCKNIKLFSWKKRHYTFAGAQN